MSLKALFEEDELDPRLEALDLMTSFHSTIRFLEMFQAAIFSRRDQNRSVLSVYQEYLLSLGLINTADDYPDIVGGRMDNPNEAQARRNLKYPMGVGSMAAYMSINLGVAKEIAADKIPNKISDKLKAEWFFEDFDVIKDEAYENPTVSRVITRLRNAVSHHNFKIRVPSHLIHKSDIKDQVEVTFYDTDKKQGNDFYAKANFRTIEKLMEKIRGSVYVFHNCPDFEGDLTKEDAISDYVGSCFRHFARAYAGRGLKFKYLKALSPEAMYELYLSAGVCEVSRSDHLKYEVCLAVNDKACEAQYIDIPFIGSNRWGEIMIEDKLYPLGPNPVEWMLTHEMSPLCRLDRKIISMLELALAN
ncbi:hypothetical protein DM819_08420 [Pseudomonas hunanensis]|uniref:pEK499-p136 HEPN domain-containing protein n=1 Tax=Pseudomonas hunanensis TaxID=1247546 RepID=A0ABD6NAX1_9PSED|nr:HEPN family nuclease [Pseudomonas hunanensis]NWL45882.1 hypothetical protein [Pseudomonas hunanensis]